LVAVRRILARHAGLPVVLLSVIDDCAIIQMGSSAGIHGYLLMEHAVEELVFALETVLKSGVAPPLLPGTVSLIASRNVTHAGGARTTSH
jgi:DNA-binding NarL/FixJ family response regulator